MDWLTDPPAGTHQLERSRPLPGHSTLGDVGRALLGWDVHRAANLKVVAEGPAGPGETVVLGMRLAGVWTLAPCRVGDVVDEDGQIGFTYVTLAGHPEQGVEQFLFVREGGAVRFEVRAVSRPAFWGSRLAPFAARRVQSDVTDRYLRAAAVAGSAGPLR